MRIVVFADIHGNLPALEKLLKNESADQYISLGDVVNYGPWSNECVDVITSVNCIRLAGNHEEFYLLGKYMENGLAGRFFEFCYPAFDRFDLIKNWSDRYEFEGFIFQHTINNMVVYPDSKISFDKNYVIGHSHHQSTHRDSGHILYCIGSVGQNRQYINRIDYLVITDGVKFELKNLTYDENSILNEMKSRKYPQEFIEYYSKKERI